jgi:pimeloyl-ACP methyl ester carboxylesterase
MECLIKDITLYYETYGEGHPIIMIHGFGPDHHIMTGCMEPIFTDRDGWQRIYFDLPGMGKTQGPDWLVNSDQMLEVVNEFIDKVIPNHPFAIAGLSYGAYLARGIVREKPKLVTGLSLLVPLIIPDFAKRRVPAHVSLVKDSELVKSIPADEREEFESYIVVQTRKVWERTRDEVDVGVATADEPFLNRLQEHGYPFSFDVDAETETYERPTLILMGKQDSAVGYLDAWKLIEKYPRGTFAVLDRAGHNLPIEQEELFNPLVNEWLDRIEETLA